MGNVKEERKKDAENGHIHELISRKSIIDKSAKKPYVFISYSSKDWHKVLYEIVYELCMKKGLRVYFDTKFDVGSDSWLKQFQENMSDKNCKAVLAFVSPNYKTSYATLMELMAACEDIASAPKPVLPIYIGNADCTDYENTGLGTRRFPDYSTNDLWDKELELFNELFNNLMASDDVIRNKDRAQAIYSRSKADISPYESRLDKDALFQNESYWKDRYIAKDDIEAKNRHWDELPDNVKNKEKGKIYLNKKGNADLVSMILSGINKNNIDGVNKDLADTVYDKLKAMGYGDVFDEVVDPQVTYHVTVRNGENKNMIPVENGGLVPKPDVEGRDGFVFAGWFVSGTDEEWDFADPVHGDMEIYAKWEAVETETEVEEYKYTIFGEKYEAGSREQGKLMFDAFEALVKRYPECADSLTQRTSVARAEDVKKANTKEADPAYFRGCGKFEVNGRKYLVGTSYGFKAKLAEIKGMFKICGADVSEFVLNGEPLKSNRSIGGHADGKDDAFEYELWGVTYTAHKMVDMINGVFRQIIEKYPEKVQDIAVSDKLTAVVRKSDLEQKTANPSKIKQFNHYKFKEYPVDGEVYCVNAGYNREGCIKQIEKMLILCEESPNAFRIIKEPAKSVRSGNKGGKTGVGELLDS